MKILLGLGFSSCFSNWLCSYLQLWFKQMYTLKTVLLIIQLPLALFMYYYDWSKLMICSIIDNIIVTSTWRKINQYHAHIDFKIFFIRKYNPSARPISTLNCIYGIWWLRRFVLKSNNMHLYLKIIWTWLLRAIW